MASLLMKMVLAGVVVLLSTPAYCEYYQYRDTDGVLRFTDDIAAVPPDQRPDVKTYRSVKSSPVQPTARSQATERNAALFAPSPSDASLPLAGTWNARISAQADELDRMQVELKKDYADLQAQRTTLGRKAPPVWATAEAHEAYRQQVDRLNDRIERYEAQYADYTEKEKAFNGRYKK